MPLESPSAPGADAPDVVVIGHGPGVLAAAAVLGANGRRALVVDRAPHVGHTWRGHYDRLRLHTPRGFSHLPGYKIPRRFGRWVARDDVVTYLEEYAAHHRLALRLGVGVERLSREGAGWRVHLADGTVIEGPHVVVATGYNNAPVAPDWPGVDSFTSEVVHASEYRTGATYTGRDVLVGDFAPGLLGANGRPTVHGTQTHPDAPNLWFLGFTNPISGIFRELAIDARRIGRAIAVCRSYPAFARPAARWTARRDVSPRCDAACRRRSRGRAAARSGEPRCRWLG
jgi:hypothetical protein